GDTRSHRQAILRGVFGVEGAGGTGQVQTRRDGGRGRAGRPAAAVQPAVGDDTFALTLYRCPRCRGPIEVFAEGTRTAAGNMTMASVALTYPPEAVSEFQELRRTCREQRLESS
ncbi:MAG: hypothetical protein K2V38_08100, partial [Gemmataceae bacterium]|nr:hypothetical protein [Gemmataceae bacterium]